jgi:pimeloyl-ACP methyl ester carboxylesterase
MKSTMARTDLVVVLPGIMGSTLSHKGRAVWAPSAGSALRAITTFGSSIKALTLPSDIGDAHPDDGVEPVSLMPDLHLLPGLWTPVKGYDVLLARLHSLSYRQAQDGTDAPPANLLPVPYDWRLSNRYNGARLDGIVRPALERWRAQGGEFADARVTFVCHSMGGLVARWYIERCGGAAITRKLITLGTPYRGAAKALEQLVNGVHRGIGPFSVDLTEFARGLPSLYQLLPEYACIDTGGGLSKVTEVDVADLSRQKAVHAAEFHSELRDAEARRPESLEQTHAIVGIQQPTSTTMEIVGGRAVPRNTYGTDEFYGDSTVPLLGACRADVPMDSNSLRRVPDKHGNLQRNAAVLNEVEGILESRPVVVRAGERIDVGVDAPELAFEGKPIKIDVDRSKDPAVAIQVVVRNEAGRTLVSQVPRGKGDHVATTIEGLPPGGYTIDVTGLNGRVEPVSLSTLVWPRDGLL